MDVANNTNVNKILINYVRYLDNDDWIRVRSLISPALKMSKLNKMKLLIDNCVDELIQNFNNQLKNDLHKHKDQNKFKINVFQLFQAYSLDSIVKLGFGTKVHSLIKGIKSNPLIQWIKSFIYISSKHFTWTFFANETFVFTTKAEIVISFLKNFTLEITKKKKKKYGNQTNKRDDFLQLMLDSCEINSSNDHSFVTKPSNQLDDKSFCQINNCKDL